MDDSQTCWTLIHAAAEGHTISRGEFVRLYQPVAIAYYKSRWSNSSLKNDVDDAVQDVFIECFRSQGVLEKVTQERPEGFRRFFFGVLRNVALRRETRPQNTASVPDEYASEEMSASQAFDQAWAQLILAEAARIQEAEASQAGPREQQRVQLLKLRFQEGLPIREIAVLWNDDPVRLHREYAIARNEFSSALRKALAFQNPGASPEQLNVTYDEFLQLLR